MNIRFSPASEFPAADAANRGAVNQTGSSGLTYLDAAAGQHSSNYPGRGISVGPREGRLSERSPAALPGAARTARFIPFKAIVSRINSAFAAARAALERLNLSQTLLDIGRICIVAVMVFASGLGLTALFLYFFVFRLQ